MRLSPFERLDSGLLPAVEPRRTAFLRARPFAHRGLHGHGTVENSRAAFRAAVAAGHGIECDVRISRDDVAFVFHDAALDRLTHASGAFAAQPARALGQIRLKGSDEAIPALAEVLALVAGAVPLLLELKAPGAQVAPLCLAVRRALEGYRGAVAIMSFNPEVPRWFGNHAPRLPRGLVVTEQDDGLWRGRIARRLALWRARPEFLACDVRDLPSRIGEAARRRGLPLLTWTVRDCVPGRHPVPHADQIIYEQPGA